MKTIMIIGAGNAQVPLIEAAKKENYHTIVCDLNPEAPGVSIADEYFRVSTKDRDSLLNVAEKNHIDGIVANSEYAMCDAAYIAENLNLIGNPEQGISILSSKSRFREMQKEIGLFTPRFMVIESAEQLNLKDIAFPVIIKPDESSGSRGVNLITDPDDMENMLNTARKFSRNGKMIIEEYIPMPFRSVIEGEIYINNGEILWDGLFQTIRSESVPRRPMTYIFPLTETKERTDIAKKALIKVFCAAGIVHGEFNVELYITDEGVPFIIEINPRQGGYDLPQYVKEHCGIDGYRFLVTTSVGDDEYWKSLKEFERENRHIIHHMLFPGRSGKFMGISISDAIEDRVYRVHMDVEDGEVLDETFDASSSIGYVDLELDSCEDQKAVSSKIEELIKVKIEQV